MKIEKITKSTAFDASRIYAMSWKSAYRGIVPDDYLDLLPLDRWESKLGGDYTDKFREDYILSDGGVFIASSSICEARDKAYSGWGEIMSIYVMPEYFRKGYGKALFSFALERLSEMGYHNIYLWVLEENIRARKFYEANDFHANGDSALLNIGGKELIEIRYIKNN